MWRGLQCRGSPSLPTTQRPGLRPAALCPLPSRGLGGLESTVCECVFGLQVKTLRLLSVLEPGGIRIRFSHSVLRREAEEWGAGKQSFNKAWRLLDWGRQVGLSAVSGWSMQPVSSLGPAGSGVHFLLSARTLLD